MNIQIAENIKRFRIARGITQSDLATLLSVSPQAVSRWENGQTYPDIVFLPDIAKYLEVSIDDLMGLGTRGNRRLEKELYERRHASIEDDAERAENELRILEIYEELASAKTFYLRGYFERLMKVKNSNDPYIRISDECVADARRMIRERMRTLNMEDRIDLLNAVAQYEDEDKLELWKDEYRIPRYLHANIWDELLLNRYSNDQEKRICQKQKILYKDLTDTLNSLDEGYSYGKRDTCNDPDHYRTALDMIGLYSTRIDDIFILHRIVMEARYAESLVKCGRAEESLGVFELVRDHLRVLHDLPDDCTLCGSVPMLDRVKVSFALQEKHVECVCRLGVYSESLYDAIRDDKRFAEFIEVKKSFYSSDECRSWVLEHGDPISDPKWHELLKRARETASTMQKDEGAVALMTTGGDIFVIKQSYGEDYLRPLIQMKTLYGSRVEKLVFALQNGSLDLPSYGFRETLLSVDERNSSAEMLLNGLMGFIVKPVRVTMGR